MTATIQLNEDAMRPVIAKAILDELGPEQRDLLIQNALDTLMKRQTIRQYGRETEQPSMLEEIIVAQTRAMAGKVVAELLATDEWRGKVEEATREGLLRGLRDGSVLTAIGDGVGQKVADVLRGDS